MYDFRRFLVILTGFVSAGCSVVPLRAAEPPDHATPTVSAPSVPNSLPTKLTLAAAEATYAKAQTAQMKIKKTLRLKLLDQTKEYKGTLTLQKPGHLRLEFETPEKSIAIVTPRKFILIQYPTDELDPTIRVTQSKDARRIQSQYLMALLMGRGSLSKEFKMVKMTPGKGLQGDQVYDLKPKQKDSDLKAAQIQIGQEGNVVVIRKISYTDQLDNVTDLEFEKSQFGLKIERNFFELKIPKGAEVTEI